MRLGWTHTSDTANMARERLSVRMPASPRPILHTVPGRQYIKGPRECAGHARGNSLDHYTVLFFREVDSLFYDRLFALLRNPVYRIAEYLDLDSLVGMSMGTWVTQLRKGLMEFCILNLLKHGESYGYDIIQSLRGIEELMVTDSTVYPILSRLRRDGYLKVRVRTSSEGPPRRYFSVTALGHQRIEEMNAYWDSLQVAIGGLRNGGRGCSGGEEREVADQRPDGRRDGNVGPATGGDG